ncbi:hypothetical protein ACQUQP_11975 [Marinobacterium sp. YM272]|uniref:hypothetical protein n=1 Tax=Marinobacterium sp. YM272 TaxID=3421654 RepID=UPI003D7FBAE4
MKYGREVLFYTVIIIFILTAAVTILGVTNVITIKSNYLDVLFTALIIELVGAVIGLFKATDWFGKEENNLSFREIEGCWWQLIRYQKTNAISFVRIICSEDLQQLYITGDSYSAEGKRHAYWYSVAASFHPETNELWYVWRGDHESEPDDFSGVGKFHFNHEKNNMELKKGTGWFTSGDIINADVKEKQKVVIKRLDEKDIKTMLSKNENAKAELAFQIYSKWNEG